jgi:hypothetical protein
MVATVNAVFFTVHRFKGCFTVYVDECDRSYKN